MKLTHELIDAAKTPKGSWTRAQLASIGVEWPPRNGWKQKLVGMEISEDAYERFRELASVRAKPLQETASGTLPGMTPEWVSRAEYDRAIATLREELEALRKEIRGESPDTETIKPPALPIDDPLGPPWEV